MFIFSDPPDHTRVRNLFMPLMTPVAVKALEQYIRDRTRALLQPHLAGGQIDFVADFGCFLPMDVIATMNGVPVDDQERRSEEQPSEHKSLMRIQHAIYC